jgi:hypothetical protein
MSRGFTASLKERQAFASGQPHWYIEIHPSEDVRGFTGETIDIALKEGTLEQDASEIVRQLNFSGAFVSFSGLDA